MGRRKTPVKVAYCIQGKPVDLKSMKPEERDVLAVKLNDIVMAAIGYERAPQKSLHITETNR